ncbi:MAG: hypothetical protein C4293_11190 [Nitrospiraceae bacterium]
MLIEAIPMLIREASALSEPAQTHLELLYEQGFEERLAPYDKQIFAYFKATAEEGLPRSRIMLARIYSHGLGVPPDLKRATNLLKGNQSEDAKTLLREIAASEHLNQPIGRNAKPEGNKSP